MVGKHTIRYITNEVKLVRIWQIPARERTRNREGKGIGQDKERDTKKGGDIWLDFE